MLSAWNMGWVLFRVTIPENTDAWGPWPLPTHSGSMSPMTSGICEDRFKIRFGCTSTASRSIQLLVWAEME